jgi:ankyrin repeat protein
MDQKQQYFLNAVILNQTEEAKFLLEESPSLISVSDADDNTALHFASSEAMASLLICKGADGSKANKKGIYPDEAAIERHQEGVANIIRRSGWSEAARG